MRTIADEVDGSFYVDIVLSPDETKRIRQMEMIQGEMILRRRKYYIGVRLHGHWDEEEKEDV